MHWERLARGMLVPRCRWESLRSGCGINLAVLVIPDTTVPSHFLETRSMAQTFLDAIGHDLTASMPLFFGLCILCLCLVELTLVAGQRRVEIRALVWFPSNGASACPVSTERWSSSPVTPSELGLAESQDMRCDGNERLLRYLYRADSRVHSSFGRGALAVPHGVMRDHVFAHHRHRQFTVVWAGAKYLLLLSVRVRDERGN